MHRTLLIGVAWLAFATLSIWILQNNGARGVVQQHIKKEFNIKGLIK